MTSIHLPTLRNKIYWESYYGYHCRLPALWRNIKHTLLACYPSISTVGIMAFCDESVRESWTCIALNALIIALSCERLMYLQIMDCPICENSCNCFSPTGVVTTKRK